MTAMLPSSTVLPLVSPKTPEEWLRVLTRRMDLRRLGVQLLRSYTDGNAPLPEMTAETRQAWQAFQRKSRTNWGELICSSVVDRLIPNGLTIGGSHDSPVAKQAQKLWRDNRMSGVFKEWVRYGMIFGQSYLTVWKGQNTAYGQSGTVITADSPETMCVVTDPLQHWRPQAALRVWRDQEKAIDYAIVWTPTAWQQFQRPTYERIELRVIPSKWLTNLAEGAWTPSEGQGSTSEILQRPIPVVIYNNPGGHGDFETHLDLINRINGGILERLVIAAILAFRQRAITGGTLPERDEQGNLIDYEKVFSPAPGVLWNLPEGLELWESKPTDISGILNASKEDIRQLSAVTRTPLPMLMPDNTNTSAEGAKATDVGHYFRCVDRLNESKVGIEEAMTLAVRVDGGEIPADEHVEIPFEPPDRVTMTEKYQAALAAHNAGESQKSVQRNVLGYSPDQIAQDAVDRAQEALLMQALQPPPVPAPGGPQSNGNGSPAPNGQQPQPKPPAGQPAPQKAPFTQGGTQPGGGRRR